VAPGAASASRSSRQPAAEKRSVVTARRKTGARAGPDVRRQAWEWATANRARMDRCPAARGSRTGTVGMSGGAAWSRARARAASSRGRQQLTIIVSLAATDLLGLRLGRKRTPSSSPRTRSWQLTAQSPMTGLGARGFSRDRPR
jgi:hypothetical protein